MVARSSILWRGVFLAALAILGGYWLAEAGNLNPPAGPVAPTMKTLDEVEPRVAINGTNTPGDANALFRIASAGSYYATGSVMVGSGRGYLQVAASHVTVDLRGVRIAGSGGSLDGIWVAPGVTNVRILNGTITGFGGHGIDLSSASGSAVADVTVSSCGGDGIRSGPSGVLRDCLVNSCGGSGFNLVSGAIAERCTARGCTGDGFFLSGTGSLRHCTSASNTASGYRVSTGGVVDECNASSNGEYGLITVANSELIRVTRSTFVSNADVGIYVGSASLIKENTVVAPNGVANIILAGNGNRVEGNQTRGTGLAVAVLVGVADNFIIGNWHHSTNGTNGFASVGAAGNVVGPVVTASGTISTTNPYANFSR